MSNYIIRRIERLIEELLLQGFRWREATAITSEAVSPAYAIANRCQLAEDVRPRT